MSDNQGSRFESIAGVERQDASEGAPLALDMRGPQTCDARFRWLEQGVATVVFQLKMCAEGAFSIPFVSDKVLDVSGVTAEAAMRDPSALLALLHPNDVPVFFDALLSSATRMAPLRGEFRIGKGKAATWMEIESVPRREPGGGVLWDGFSVDITMRRRVEMELQESRERYHSFLAQSSEGIYRLEMEVPVPTDLPVEEQMDLFYQRAYVAECNQRFAEMYQAGRPEALLGARVADFPGQPDRATLRKFILSGYRVTGEETAEVTLTGTARHFSNNAMGIVEDGRLVRMWCTQQDVTGRKREEEERERLQSQLVQAQRMESVGRLAGGIAHDFNNMLTVVLANAELALEQVDPSESLHADLLEIQKAGRHSAGLVRQLLAFARMQTVAPQVLNLNETAGGMFKMLQRLIGEDIDLVWMPGSALWPVRIDAAQIDQVLANLCVNARDATSGAGRVTIQTENVTVDDASCAGHPGFRPGDFVMLAVGDDGAGMEEAVLGHIFEPFFTTKGVGQGIGLGLATVHGIVEQNQGFIDVHSQPGQGTTFRVYLPRASGDPEGARPTDAQEPPMSQGETVLLVEDEPATLRVASAMLRRLGYSVLAAGSPAEAIHAAQDHPEKIHLVITDVVMPEMNGRDLATRLHEVRPDMKCLFMSGYTANVIARHGVLDDGVHLLAKPFSVRDVAFKVREMLGDC